MSDGKGDALELAPQGVAGHEAKESAQQDPVDAAPRDADGAPAELAAAEEERDEDDGAGGAGDDGGDAGDAEANASGGEEPDEKDDNPLAAISAEAFSEAGGSRDNLSDQPQRFFDKKKRRVRSEYTVRS
jgi:hypothetical protein